MTTQNTMPAESLGTPGGGPAPAPLVGPGAAPAPSQNGAAPGAVPTAPADPSVHPNLNTTGPAVQPTAPAPAQPEQPRTEGVKGSSDTKGLRTDISLVSLGAPSGKDTLQAVVMGLDEEAPLVGDHLVLNVGGEAIHGRVEELKVQIKRRKVKDEAGNDYEEEDRSWLAKLALTSGVWAERATVSRSSEKQLLLMPFAEE